MNQTVMSYSLIPSTAPHHTFIFKLHSQCECTLVYATLINFIIHLIHSLEMYFLPVLIASTVKHSK